MNRGLLFLPVAMFLLLGILLYAGLGRDAEHIDSPLLDRPLPAFRLPDLLDDSVQRSESDLAGQPSLLNVWATWCISCRVEHPYLVKLAREQGVRIIGLNYKDNVADARQWLSERGDPYAFTVMDAQGRLGLDLGVYGAPETYLIDAQGVIRGKHVGVIDETTWQRVIGPQWQSLQEGAP